MITLNKESLKQWQEENLEHLRYEYDLKPDDYVIDIGSYRREWADEITKRYHCKVECFDALDNRAAWTYDGKIKMGGAFYYTSMFSDEINSEFNCVDIAKFLNEEVALMKINIEGGEYLLLNYIIEKGLHKNIKNLQIQFHEVEGMEYELAYKMLVSELSKTHKLTWHYPYVWENWKLC